MLKRQKQKAACLSSCKTKCERKVLLLRKAMKEVKMEEFIFSSMYTPNPEEQK
jgi:hypothetical protein